MSKWKDSDLITFYVYLNPDEQKVFHELYQKMDLSTSKIFVQGLRLLQLYHAGDLPLPEGFEGCGGCMGDD